MKVAAIFPVGTSIGGAPDAIREILNKESAVEVYLLYGEAAAAGTRDPKELAEQIRSEITDSRVTWGRFQMVHPFDLADTYQKIRDFIRDVDRHENDRVYVGITGGTNPMNASLFQTAMAYLRSEVVPLYVQAHEGVRQQNFVASEIRDRVIAEEALAAARSGQIRVASRLAEHLPSIGRWKFLRESLKALSYWDDFDYSQASHSLQQQARRCGDYSSDQLLSPVAYIVARISENAIRMSDFTKQIRDERNFDARATVPKWPEHVKEIGGLLVADALANANRRMVEGRFTDSVLRSYRAAECATQMRLLAIGIHPACPDACATAYRRYFPSDACGPRELAFMAGLKLLESAGQLDLDSLQDSVRGLADVRNHTYLEHGYRRVQRDQSERCFSWALDICQVLLGSAIREKWREFEMQF